MNNVSAIVVVAKGGFENSIGIWCKRLQVFDAEVAESRVIFLTIGLTQTM